MKTIIVCALFCCGKTYTCNTCDRYKIVDLDEMIKPHPQSVPSNYKHIYYRDSMIPYIEKYNGTCDFIFLSVKGYILKELYANNIPYSLVYPEYSKECKREWKRRNRIRNTEWLWRDHHSLFFSIIKNLQSDSFAIHKYELNADQYISDIIDTIYKDNVSL